MSEEKIPNAGFLDWATAEARRLNEAQSRHESESQRQERQRQEHTLSARQAWLDSALMQQAVRAQGLVDRLAADAVRLFTEKGVPTRKISSIPAFQPQRPVTISPDIEVWILQEAQVRSLPATSWDDSGGRVYSPTLLLTSAGEFRTHWGFAGAYDQGRKIPESPTLDQHFPILYWQPRQDSDLKLETDPAQTSQYPWVRGPWWVGGGYAFDGYYICDSRSNNHCAECEPGTPRFPPPYDSEPLEDEHSDLLGRAIVRSLVRRNLL
jgi:hypothetical protein